MPFRSKETLERWLEEFSPSLVAGQPARVVVHDGPIGADTGLVVVPLLNATTSVHVTPVAPGGARYQVTIEPQLDETVLSGQKLRELAAELLVAAELCEYLEVRSVQHLDQFPWSEIAPVVGLELTSDDSSGRSL